VEVVDEDLLQEYLDISKWRTLRKSIMGSFEVQEHFGDREC
jgi:hypothetical protein